MNRILFFALSKLGRDLTTVSTNLADVKSELASTLPASESKAVNSIAGKVSIVEQSIEQAQYTLTLIISDIREAINDR